jgi:hypothetical protein
MAKGRKGMKSCPTGVICTSSNTFWLILCVALIVGGLVMFVYAGGNGIKDEKEKGKGNETSQIFIIPSTNTNQNQNTNPNPNLPYPEPVTRFRMGRFQNRDQIQQVGIITGEGGSSSSAAPDRTILPLYGRELDARRGKWNYYTRTDGMNPVQVPVRVGNRVCDDDTNGCNELYSDDSVHVPALGRAFTATVYRRSVIL